MSNETGHVEQQGPTGSRDRSLTGKARIRARRASNQEGDNA
jgi:hypothetical protein